MLSANDQSLSDLVNEILTIDSPNINLSDAENEILESPIFKNLILSEDATTTGIIVFFKRNNDYENLINERDNLKNKETLSSSEKEKKLIIENSLARIVEIEKRQESIGTEIEEAKNKLAQVTTLFKAKKNRIYFG